MNQDVPLKDFWIKEHLGFTLKDIIVNLKEWPVKGGSVKIYSQINSAQRNTLD